MLIVIHKSAFASVKNVLLLTKEELEEVFLRFPETDLSQPLLGKEGRIEFTAILPAKFSAESLTLNSQFSILNL